jgi:hypothetical protein
LENKNNQNALVQPLVSIIIVNYNGYKYLGTCLSSLLPTCYKNYEIIVVDNNSSDDSVKKIKYYQNIFQDKLKLISLKENTGFTGGNNSGLSKAKGEYVVFLNNDTKVSPEWLSELVNVMEKRSEVGFAQSLLVLLGKGNCRIDSAGDFIDYFGRSSRRGGDWPEHMKAYSKVDEIFSGRGAALIIRMKIIEEIGSFDPLFFATYEDVDLCWRIRLRGYKGVLVPSSVVYHKGSGTSHALIPFHLTKNLLLTHYKNYDFSNMIKYSALVVVGGQLMQDLFEKKPLEFRERLKALIWFTRNFKAATLKRLYIQYRVRRVSDEKIKESMLRSSVGFIFLYMLYKAKYGWATASKWYYQRTWCSKCSMHGEKTLARFIMAHYQ